MKSPNQYELPDAHELISSIQEELRRMKLLLK